MQLKEQFSLAEPMTIFRGVFYSFFDAGDASEAPPRQTLNTNWAKNRRRVDSESTQRLTLNAALKTSTLVLITIILKNNILTSTLLTHQHIPKPPNLPCLFVCSQHRPITLNGTGHIPDLYKHYNKRWPIDLAK